ncbi:MAG: hypothetical protein QME14_02290 [Methanobacteriaceae archaeon]|nr:hypothetical protein [Methanobacteriaceae archaeon]
MPRKSKSKKMVGIRCQCQDRAVERKKFLLRDTHCKKCGRLFKTNRDVDLCFLCENKKA